MRTALALIASISVLVVACGPGAAAPATPGPSATGSVTSPSPTPTALAGIELEWRRAAFPKSPDDSAVTDVTAWDRGFVAVGFDGGSRSMVWTSADGSEWTQVPHQPAFDAAVMTGVTAVNGRLVAVGRDVTSVEEHLAAAWTSEDGLTWRRAESAGLEGGQVIRVIAGGAGLIAVGSDLDSDAAAAWTSTDGTRWSRVPHASPFDHAFLWDVAATPAGIVAAGWRRAPEPTAAVWTSVDGREWSLAGELPGAPGYEIRAIAATARGLVAAGSVVQGGDAVSWTSTDGRSWARTAPPQSFAGAGITTLLPARDGLIALGGRDLSAAVWIAPDGGSWSAVETGLFAGAYMTSGALGAGRVVAVGATQRRIEGTGSFIQSAAAWYATPRSR